MNKPVLSKIDQSIHILNTLINNINKDLNALLNLAHYKIDEQAVEPIHVLTYNYGIIQISSYLDEYNSFFVNQLTPDQTTEMRPYIDRVFKEINRFSGIKKYRNNVLAHNLRRNEKNVYLYGDFRTYSIPQNLSDYVFLVRCINTLTDIINGFFPNSYDNALLAVEVKQQENTTALIPHMSDEKVTKLLVDLQNDLNSLNSVNPG